jgi:hypothetical protein
MKREDVSYNTASTREVGGNLILLYCSVLNDAHGDDYGGVSSSDFVSGVVIADGVTGTEKGSVASRIAVEESLSLIKSLDVLRKQDVNRNIQAAFSTMVKRLPELIRKKMGSKVSSSGTTLAVAITDLTRLYVFNIGDSDIFLYPFVKDYSSIATPDYMKLSAGFSGGPVLLHSVSDSGLEGRIDHVQLAVPSDGFALLLGSDGADLKNKFATLFQNLSTVLNQYQKSHEGGKEMVSEAIQGTLSTYLKKEKLRDDDGTVALMVLLPKRSETHYRGYISVARSTKQSAKLELQGGNVPSEVRNLFQEITIDTVPDPAFEGHLEIRILDKVPGLAGIGVYKSFDISTRGNGSYKLKNLNIVFKVEQEWLSKIDVEPSNVKVFGIDGGPDQFGATMISQKGKYYFFSADLTNKGRYAIGVPEGKMLESKLKERLGQIDSKHKALNDKVEGISSDLSSKQKSQQKILEDNVKKIRGDLDGVLQPIRGELSDIRDKIDQQRKDFEIKTRTLDTSIKNLAEQVQSLKTEKAATKKSQEAPTKNIGSGENLRRSLQTEKT